MGLNHYTIKRETYYTVVMISSTYLFKEGIVNGKVSVAKSIKSSSLNKNVHLYTSLVVISKTNFYTYVYSKNTAIRISLSKV